MRPTPKEVIASARALLRDHVAPELSSEGRTYLRRVMSVMRDAHWDDAAFELLHENKALADLILRCLDADVELPAVVVAELHDAVAAADAAGTPRSFAEANALNGHLRAALVAMFEAMREGRVARDEVLGGLVLEALGELQQTGALTNAGQD